MKKIIFGPLVASVRRAIKALDTFLNPCPPPQDQTPRAFSFHEKLFLS
jgi:hypothetical protein